MKIYKRKAAKKKAERAAAIGTEVREEDRFPVVHWFPGHMAKATKMIREYVRKVDAVIELLDARIPVSSANPVIGDIAGDTPHIVLLNKADLADAEMTAAWVAHFKAAGRIVLAVDSKSGKGNAAIVRAVETACRPVIERWERKGVMNRTMRTIILGIPNVGKSTLINALAGTAATRTADKAGYTRGQQWVRIGKQMELLDTPGVLWPKIEDQRAATRLALTGALSDDVYDLESVMTRFLRYMLAEHPERLASRYGLKEDGLSSEEETISEIGRKRGCLVKGGAVDFDKARRIILSDFRSGHLGRLTLDALTELEVGEPANGEPDAGGETGLRSEPSADNSERMGGDEIDA